VFTHRAAFRSLPVYSIAASPAKRPPYAGEAERISDQPTPSKLVQLTSIQGRFLLALII
jgi:hypothetical protein